MPIPDPFPLNISEKQNSPQLLAWFESMFGTELYLSAEEINKMVLALMWLKENIGAGGGVTSMQQMFNLLDENLDVTDGDQTTKVRPNGLNVSRQSDGRVVDVTPDGVAAIGMAMFTVLQPDGIVHQDLSDIESEKSTTVSYETPTGVGNILIPDVGNSTDKFALLSQLESGSTVPGTVVANIAARDAYDVPAVPFNVMVNDDGDGNWALYMAVTTGVGATFRKTSDPDLLNAVMTNAAIKIAYESNSNTNAFTDAEKLKLGGGFSSEVLSAIAGVVGKTLYKSSAYGSVIATTTQTTIHTFNIAAGTTAADTQLELILNLARTAVAGSVTINVYLNSISTPTQLGQCLYGAGANRQIPFERTFNIQGATIDQADRLNNIISDKTVGSTNRSTIAYNPAVLNQIIVTVTVSNAADNVYPAPYSLTQY